MATGGATQAPGKEAEGDLENLLCSPLLFTSPPSSVPGPGSLLDPSKPISVSLHLPLEWNVPPDKAGGADPPLGTTVLVPGQSFHRFSALEAVLGPAEETLHVKYN